MAEREKEAPSSEVFGTEEALAKIAMELLKPEGEKLLTVTDVTPEEIFGLPTLLSFSDYFKSKLIKDWIRNFLLLRISRLRMGRREFILLSTGIKEVAEARKRGGRIGDLFAGLK
jgi:hypothetical protein